MSEQLRAEFEAGTDKQWLQAEHGVTFEWDASSKNPDMHRYKHKIAWFMYQAWLRGRAAATERAEKAEKRLGWWETPHDQEQFDAIRMQASHKDSLAAQTIYIGHLERRVKELQARIGL